MVFIREARTVRRVGGLSVLQPGEWFPEEAHCGVANEDIFQRMRQHAQGDIVLEEDNSIYEKGDILKSFHHQTRQPMS